MMTTDLIKPPDIDTGKYIILSVALAWLCLLSFIGGGLSLPTLGFGLLAVCAWLKHDIEQLRKQNKDL